MAAKGMRRMPRALRIGEPNLTAVSENPIRSDDDLLLRGYGSLGERRPARIRVEHGYGHLSGDQLDARESPLLGYHVHVGSRAFPMNGGEGSA